jgi:cell wall-associated NlpC family hydrolase
MKSFFTFFIVVVLLSCSSAFAQKVIKHKVKSGESIYSIARTYDVTEKDIYELNPRLKGKVLSLKTVVEIPNRKYKEEEMKPKEKKNEEVVIVPALSASNDSYVIHTVIAKETLYSLSKQYGISMEAICELNPELKTGNLKTGAKLKFPSTIKIVDLNNQIKAPKSVEIPATYDKVVATTDVIHNVQPKETLYRISKKYGVSVAQLQEWNPGVASGLPVGYNLIVKKGTDVPVTSSNPVVVETSAPVAVEPHSLENMSKADFLIAKASQHIGTRYRSGGTAPGGFDCSGLMCATFNEIEMSLPRTSGEQSNHGITIDKSQAQKGDLIFFSTNGRGRINHVGMITEIVDDEIKFIHSSIQAGVIISSTKEAYYAKRFVKVNRVLLE